MDKKKCPDCGADAEADFVDIGVGEMRCSPWGCPECFWTEDAIPNIFGPDGEYSGKGNHMA